ncbi:hypothetical protein KVR01_000040 [Diaporthe batatas]|uniref:uncharacterized protein n=1 Tax=Diaporthe batatas TaxID=748121 RepID=UPI001D036C36|nr:uncharacterized protein KVR01_000040 [Diaporthe batatas]KAG8169295.1 hypothetical protein KVR01_000040 [Diaporthe batatas]
MSSQTSDTEVPPKPVETSPLLSSANQPGGTETRDQQPPQQPPPVNTNVKPAMDHSTQTPVQRLPKVDTDMAWATPAGLRMRDNNDESQVLTIFRRAVGINSDKAGTFTDSETLEKGRRRAVGVYKSVIEQQRRKRLVHHTLGIVLYISHFLQIVLAAVLTALGPNAKNYEVPITILGAVNTVVAGVLALLKGSGVIERVSKDEVDFKKLQDWIEETEAMISVGILGRSRKDVGILVEQAFRKYNACFGQAYEIMSSSNIQGMGDSRDRDDDR